MNVFTLFTQAYVDQQDRVLFVNADISFNALEQGSAQYANLLCDLGVQQGDRVCMYVDKSIDSFIFYLACLRAGVIYQPLNPGFKVSEVDYYLKDAAPRLLICNDNNIDSVAELIKKYQLDPIFTLNNDNTGSLIETRQHYSNTFTTVEQHDSDLAALLYSSGTTGKPKGIGISHGNLIANAKALVTAWDMHKDDVLLHALPLFHVHGLFIAMHSALTAGSQIHLLNTFSIDAVIRNIPNASVFMGVPTFYTRLLQDPRFNTALCKDMRLFTCGSAPLLVSTFEAIEQQIGHRPLERYGMTEAAGVITSNPLNGERRAGSVGTPLTAVDIKIVNDNKQLTQADEKGELYVKGPNIFNSYWHRPAATQEAFTEDGYYKTGDMAEISADGYIQIVGRNKDLIISGGENIYPKEIEDCIDNIEGIVESAVIGIPHADFGEQVCAVIVAADSFTLNEESVMTALKQQLASFKVPRKIHIVNTLPRNAMGKVQKNVLRKEYTIR